MKFYLWTALCCCLFSCNSSSNQFDFLIGEWQMNQSIDSEKTYEIWTKINDQNYFGHGFTIKDSDTIFQEKMYLENKKGKWNLKIDLMNGEKATIFQIKSFDKSHFVAVNKQNQFPKKIQYQSPQEHLLDATISDDEQKFTFHFKRRN